MFCFRRKAFSKLDTVVGLTRSVSLKWCKILVWLRNFNYEVSVLNLAPCNFTGCWRGGTLASRTIPERLTDFCPLKSLGRQRESGRASRNHCVLWELIALLLMLLGWGLSRLFVAIANVIKWWSNSPRLWGKTFRSTIFIPWDKTRSRVWLWRCVGLETCWKWLSRLHSFHD